MANEYLFEVVEKASNGDRKAFEELIKLKSETILFHSLSILGKYQDAEDAAQEVVLKMYKNLSGLKNPKAFNGWMQRIISNVCYSMGRKKQSRHEQLNFEDYVEELVEEEKEFLPYEYVESQEAQGKLKQIIDELPDKRKRAIMMYYFDDMSYSEIAYAMEVTTSTVSTNILQAKKMIKEEMEGHMSKENKTAMNFAAVPVLTQVLNDQAREKISTSQVNEFAKSSIKMVRKVSNPAKYKALEIAKAAAVVTVAGGVGIAGIIGLNVELHSGENITPVAQEITFEPRGEVEFVGGECDCGHLNPTGAEIDEVDSDYSDVTWEVLASSGETVKKGSGGQAIRGLEELLDAKKDGIYKVVFTLENEKGQKAYLERDFHIDSDKDEHTIYE